MGSPDRQNINPLSRQTEVTDSEVYRQDPTVGSIADGDGDFKARLGLDGNGQVCIIKPLPNGEVVAVPFLAKPDNKNPT